jgi:hypothetical protein
MVPPPVAAGLVLCRYVHFEEGDTQQATLIGCFHKLAVEAFPATTTFYAYVALTDGVGDATIKVQVERLDTEEVLYTREAQAHFPSKLHTVQASFAIRQCTFAAAGDYQVSLLVDNEWVAHRQLKVYQR